MNKWQKLIWLVPIVALVIAAVPSFTDFNAAHFSTAGNVVSIIYSPLAGTATNVVSTGSNWLARVGSGSIYNTGSNYLQQIGSTAIHSVGSNYMSQLAVTNIQADTGDLQFKRADGTAIIYIDDTTGALLWNAHNTYNIGASAGNRPGSIYLGNELNASGAATAAAFITSARYAITGIGTANGSFRVTSPGVYASTVAGLDRLAINGPVEALTDEAATPIFSINSRTNSFCGGVIDYTVFCQDATPDSQVLSGVVTYAAANTNGVWYPIVTEAAANQAKAATAGTLTVTWSAAGTPGAGDNATTNLSLTITPDTSLSPAAGQFYILWQIRNNGTNAITAL